MKRLRLDDPSLQMEMHGWDLPVKRTNRSIRSNSMPPNTNDRVMGNPATRARGKPVNNDGLDSTAADVVAVLFDEVQKSQNERISQVHLLTQNQDALVQEASSMLSAVDTALCNLNQKQAIVENNETILQKGLTATQQNIDAAAIDVESFATIAKEDLDQTKNEICTVLRERALLQANLQHQTGSLRQERVQTCTSERAEIPVRHRSQQPEEWWKDWTWWPNQWDTWKWEVPPYKP